VAIYKKLIIMQNLLNTDELIKNIQKIINNKDHCDFFLKNHKQKSDNNLKASPNPNKTATALHISKSK
jgi:hypothetical protein